MLLMAFALLGLAQAPALVQTDHWTLSVLQRDTPKAIVLAQYDVVGIYFDHSLPPLKDRKGKIVAKPYGISLDLISAPTKDKALAKEIANKWPTGCVELNLWGPKDPKKSQYLAPPLKKTIWLYGVIYKQTNAPDPKTGVESIFLTFDEANWVNEHGQTYQDDKFGPGRDHRHYPG